MRHLNGDHEKRWTVGTGKAQIELYWRSWEPDVVLGWNINLGLLPKGTIHALP